MSNGKERIEKVVLFTSTPIANLFNMGFGDLAEDATVFFIGSTPNRTALYCRILKTNHKTFSNDFIIGALIADKNNLKEVLFDPISSHEYLGFLVKKIV